MDINEYCLKLGSKDPVPGGGSAAGIVLSLAAGCIEKSIRFSIADDDMKNPFLQKVMEIRKSGIKYSEMDQFAFLNWGNARKLPKGTEEEKKIRNDKIKEHLVECINVPFDLCRINFELLMLINDFLPSCNKFLISDAAVGTSFSYSSFESGIFNIEINLPFLKDEFLKKKYMDYIKDNRDKFAEIKNGILKICEEKIFLQSK